MVLERVGSSPSISLTSFLLPPPLPLPARPTHPTDQPTPSLRSALFSGSFHGCHGRRPPAVVAAPAAVATTPPPPPVCPLPLYPSGWFWLLFPSLPPSLFPLSPSSLILSQPKLSGGEKRSWQEGMYAPSLPPLPSLAGLMNQLIKVYGFTHGGLSGTKSTRALQAWKQAAAGKPSPSSAPRGVI